MMRQTGDNEGEAEGGRTAERLREFSRKRLPAGASPEELNLVAAKSEKEYEEQAGSETDGDQSTSSGN
jgi:hypothetical protein